MGGARISWCGVGLCAAMLAAGGCGGSPTSPGHSGPAVLLSANVVDPISVNAVSDFHSCSGHAFPDGAPNSEKNYFWPNSTNFSTNGVLQEFAACDGTTGQNSDDTSANEQDRGITVHLYCDSSSTALRYFHIVLSVGLGQHVRAGDLLGTASMVGTGQTPSVTWQNSSNFDIAVSATGDDNITENYFSALTATAFSAWASRGLTSASQTINANNPTCAAFNSNPGSADIFSFTPVR